MEKVIFKRRYSAWRSACGGMPLCSHGLRKHFDFPHSVKEIVVHVSNKKPARDNDFVTIKADNAWDWVTDEDGVFDSSVDCFLNNNFPRSRALYAWIYYED